MKSSNLKESILKTLIYSDIFDFPLTSQEICRYLIGKKAKNVEVDSSLKSLRSEGRITSLKEFNFLPGREKTVNLRLEKERHFARKFKIAQRTARMLSFLPGVQLVGLTGALAMANSQKKDDIDFLVITSPNLLWTTRFLVSILLSILGKKRGRNSRKVTDKICLNLFIDERNVGFNEKNLYFAHEILQMRPLMGKGEIYQKFIASNAWVFDFLPNWTQEKYALISKKEGKVGRLFYPLEKALKFLQLTYMYPHKTTEHISDNLLKFHPHDMKKIVLERFRLRLTQLKILDKNINSS